MLGLRQSKLVPCFIDTLAFVHMTGWGRGFINEFWVWSCKGGGGSLYDVLEDFILYHLSTIFVSYMRGNVRKIMDEKSVQTSSFVDVLPLLSPEYLCEFSCYKAQKWCFEHQRARDVCFSALSIVSIGQLQTLERRKKGCQFGDQYILANFRSLWSSITAPLKEISFSYILKKDTQSMTNCGRLPY